mgnify:FL=1
MIPYNLVTLWLPWQHVRNFLTLSLTRKKEKKEIVRNIYRQQKNKTFSPTIVWVSHVNLCHQYVENTWWFSNLNGNNMILKLVIFPLSYCLYSQTRTMHQPIHMLAWVSWWDHLSHHKTFLITCVFANIHRYVVYTHTNVHVCKANCTFSINNLVVVGSIFYVIYLNPLFMLCISLFACDLIGIKLFLLHFIVIYSQRQTSHLSIRYSLMKFQLMTSSTNMQINNFSVLSTTLRIIIAKPILMQI